MTWQSKNVLKSSPLWKKIDKDTRYDLLGMDERTINEIHARRLKRIEKRAKAKAEKDGLVAHAQEWVENHK